MSSFLHVFILLCKSAVGMQVLCASFSFSVRTKRRVEGVGRVMTCAGVFLPSLVPPPDILTGQRSGRFTRDRDSLHSLTSPWGFHAFQWSRPPQHLYLSLHILRFKIKWKYGGQIHETWHIHTDGFFQTIFSFLHFLSKFQLPYLTNIHAELLYWFLEWHWR